MELKKRSLDYCKDWGPEYDSTKENFDALERRINTLMGSITALEKRIKDLETMEILTSNCLAALEAKVDAPEKLCGRCDGRGKFWLLTTRWGEGVTRETCPDCKGTGKQPPDTCEPKVDAAEKSVICPDCHGYGRDIFRKAVLEETCLTCHGMGKVNPVSPTCGNCKKAWRKDDKHFTVLCDENEQRRIARNYGHAACSHHERRA